MQNGTVVLLGQAAKAALAERGAAIEDLGLTVEQALAYAPVQGSEVLLARMTENVIDNAVRHNQPSGWISVTTATDGPLARLTVETGGRVLDQREVSGLGQPFRRLGAERTGSEEPTRRRETKVFPASRGAASLPRLGSRSGTAAARAADSRPGHPRAVQTKVQSLGPRAVTTVGMTLGTIAMIIFTRA